MFSKPLAYPSTLDRRPPVALCAAVAVLRGGVLEPEPHTRAENGRLKPTQIPSVHFPADDAEGLSLSGGASISTYRLFKLSITLGSDVGGPRKRRPVGSPSVRLVMRLGS